MDKTQIQKQSNINGVGFEYEPPNISTSRNIINSDSGNYPCLVYRLKIQSQSNGDKNINIDDSNNGNICGIQEREGSILMRQLQHPPINNQQRGLFGGIELINGFNGGSSERCSRYDPTPTPPPLYIHEEGGEENGGMDLPLPDDLEILDVVGLDENGGEDPFAQFNDEEIDGKFDERGERYLQSTQSKSITDNKIPMDGNNENLGLNLPEIKISRRRGIKSTQPKKSKSTIGKTTRPQTQTKRGRKPKNKDTTVAIRGCLTPPNTTPPPASSSALCFTGGYYGLNTQMMSIPPNSLCGPSYSGWKIPPAHTVPPQPFHTLAPFVFVRGKWMVARFRCELCGVVEGSPAEMDCHRWDHPYEQTSFLEIHPFTGLPFLRHECPYLPGFEKKNPPKPRK